MKADVDPVMLRVVIGGQEILAEGDSNTEKKLISPLVSVDDEMSGYVVRAREMIASKDYADAIDILQALLNRSEQCFVSTKDPRRFVSLAVCARAEIGRLSPVGMKKYRDLYNPRAEMLFRAAAGRIDETALRSIVDRYMYTSYGSRSLEMLGALLFDRGEFSQSARCFRRVVFVNGRDDSRRSPKDEAVLLARIAVAHHFAGESKEASEILNLLIKRYPQAVAAFGGTDENVVEFVRRMLAKPLLQTNVQHGEDWPSLAGAPDSVAVMCSCEPVLTPRWNTLEGELGANPNIKIKAAAVSFTRRGSRAPARTTKVSLREGRVVLVTSYSNRTTETVMPPLIHPIVVGDTVLYRAAEGVVACELSTGEKMWETIDYPLFRSIPTSGARSYNTLHSTMAEDGGLWTVTAGGGKVFATGGLLLWQSPYYSNMVWRRQGKLTDTSVLAAFSISDQGRRLWQIGNGEGNSDVVMGGKFLTAPTYVAGRLYTVVEHIQSYHLVCLDAENGRVVWEAPIAQTSVQTTRHGGIRQNSRNRASPPAVSDGKVFVVTNAGVAAAFDVDTGRSIWAYQYQSNSGMSAPVNPLVVTKGRVICLPADSEKLLAFRMDTGQMDWSVDRRKQRHLTVVDGSRLLLSSEGLIVVDAVGGQDIWKAKDVSGIHGRPAVTTDAILTSGRGEIIRVSLSDFSLSRPPLVDPGAILGNLVCVDEKMIAANAAGLSAYFAFEDTHAELTNRIKKVPPEDVPNLLYHRAVNAFSAGYPKKALVDLLATRQAAEERNNNVLMSKTSQMLYRTYISLADHETSSPPAMLGLYNKASEYAYSDRSRGEMLVRLSKYYSKNGASARAVELAQEVTEKYPKVDLADVLIGTDADRFVRDTVDTKRFMGYELGNRMIKDLISRHGRKCYSVFDTKAASNLAAVTASDDADAMVRVADTYRHSTSAPMALLRAAESRYRRALRLKKPADRKPLSLAGGNIHRLMREYPDSGLAASAELGLAMIYQRVSLRLMWIGLRGLEELPPDARVSFAGVSGQAGGVLKRLTSQLPPPRTINLNLPGPIGTPLKQIFRSSKAGLVLILRRNDRQPVRDGDSLFLLIDGCLARFNPAAATFEEAIKWKTATVMNTSTLLRTGRLSTLQAGLTGDSTVLVIASQRGGIVGTDAKTGKVLWRRSSSEKIVIGLHSTVMDGDRLVILTHGGEIVVLDMHNGKEIWKIQTPSKGTSWLFPPQVTRQDESSKSSGILLVCKNSRGKRQAMVFDMTKGELLGSFSVGQIGHTYLTPDGLIVVCDGKSLRLIEPVLGIDRSIWSIDMPAGKAPVILDATGTHVVISPVVGSNVVELRSLADNGRIVRTFQCKKATPNGAMIVGNRLYVTIDAQTYSRHLPMIGRAPQGHAPVLNVFELTSAKMLWSADLQAQPGKLVRAYLMPLQVGQNHLCVMIKANSHGISPAVMIIETSGGKIAQRLTLPNTKGIDRRQQYARHMLLSSPVITAGRLVVETCKGLEVYGKQ